MMETVTPWNLRFADYICELAGAESQELHQAAALASNAVEQGHVYADLSETHSAEQLEGLCSFAVIGAPGDFTPLVLDGAGRLYLYRYWNYQNNLLQGLRFLAGQEADDVEDSLLERGLSRLFPAQNDGDADQRHAAETAVKRRLCVITGGPGTGKTWTVVRILALLVEQARARGSFLRSALAAPTGKAVARLSEAVNAARQDGGLPVETRDQIPDRGYTLHRLLGAIPGSSRFRYDADHPLPYQVVVVDEASMVDLALMSRLVQALPGDSRLILVGDRDQLASVEPGHVFGDLCASTDLARIVELRRNYRFAPDSGIARLADAIRSGDSAQALAVLRDIDQRDITWLDRPDPKVLGRILLQPVLEGYSRYLEATSPEQALRRFNRFRILCAVRHGPYGTRRINDRCESILADAGLIRPRPGRGFKGKPILVTRNDYGLGLYNGDAGILWSDPAEPGRLTAYFIRSDGSLKPVSPARLPPHESSWAITVHKSQGSQFEDVLLVLPDREIPLISRELLYTAVTRARNRVLVVGRKFGFSS